jgi:hypothetical protein
MLARIVVAFSLALLQPLAAASPLSDAAGRCLGDNTTGKERKELARWVFIAMAAHPEIKSLSNASAEVGIEASKATARLFTRLIAENCPAEISALVKAEGPQSLRYAFEILGQIAMQELMTNKEVSASLTGFEQYTDRPRIAAVINAK